MDYTERKRKWWLHLKVSYIQMSISYISSLHNTLWWEMNAVIDGKIYCSSGMVSFFRRCWIILRIATWLPSSLRNNTFYIRGYLAYGGCTRNKMAADKTDNNSHINTLRVFPPWFTFFPFSSLPFLLIWKLFHISGQNERNLIHIHVCLRSQEIDGTGQPGTFTTIKLHLALPVSQNLL